MLKYRANLESQKLSIEEREKEFLKARKRNT
jgi:hypothetical protein